MAGKSVNQAVSVLNWLRGTVFPTVATPYYVALLHTYSSTDDTGASDVETTYTNYARQSIASTTAGWTAPSPGTSGSVQTITNAALLTFPTAGATGDTGINGFALCVHLATAVTTAGEEIYRGAITGAPKVINASDPVSIAIGALSLTED